MRAVYHGVQDSSGDDQRVIADIGGCGTASGQARVQKNRVWCRECLISFPEEEITVAVPLFLDLILMVDAGADDLFIDIGIPAHDPARAVPLAILHHLACKPPDDRV